MSVLDQVKFDDKGLVTAVARDAKSGRVVMLAYMNQEALRLTIETKIAHYFSRSRNKLWKKGESSGHLQEIQGIFIDCDGDAILLNIEQKGAACHKGYFSCFFREIKTIDQEPEIHEERLFDPDAVYKK